MRSPLSSDNRCLRDLAMSYSGPVLRRDSDARGLCAFYRVRTMPERDMRAPLSRTEITPYFKRVMGFFRNVRRKILVYNRIVLFCAPFIVRSIRCNYCSGLRSSHRPHNRDK